MSLAIVYIPDYTQFESATPMLPYVYIPDLDGADAEIQFAFALNPLRSAIEEIHLQLRGNSSSFVLSSRRSGWVQDM